MSLMFVLFVATMVVLFFVWLIALQARRKGKIKQQNGVVQLVDAFNVQAAKLVGVAVEASTDHVAAAEVNIKNAQKDVEEFGEQILNLREVVRLGEKKIPGLKASVTKWESIFTKATEANDEEGAKQASIKLKNADEALKTVEDDVKENRKVLEQLESQKDKYRSGIESAEMLKERLAVKKTSAELRQKAKMSGVNAGTGIAGLDDLKEDVDRAEARAEALEESSAEDNSLENKYGDVDAAHDARLAALRAKVGK